MTYFFGALIAAALTLVPLTALAGPHRHREHVSRSSAVRTPATGRDLERELARAHREVFGREPSRERLSLAWAQTALESGRGAKMRGNNPGGLGPGWRFRDLREGSRAYWRMLRDRFPRALACFDRGDVACASAALSRYHRASPARYRAGLEALSAEYERGKR